jgi:hypothetical protein
LGPRKINDSCSQRQLRVVNLSPAEPLTDKLHKETRLRECPATLPASNGFHVDATTPCRFILLIPLDLPPLLDPSIPPPPYLVAGAVDQPRIRDAVRTALRPAVVGALHELLGTGAPVSPTLIISQPCA